MAKTKSMSALALDFEVCYLARVPLWGLSFACE